MNMNRSRDEDFQKISTLEELRQFVNRDESHGRTKFALRVFYVLQFVKDHPEAMQEVGASWCQDQVHFVANSKQLADFLKLRSNSVNTNFRAHGFKIVSNNNIVLKKEFPSIKETGHWKIRYSNSPSFRSDSVGKDIESIKLIEQSNLLNTEEGNDESCITTSISNNISFIPKETIELLLSDQQQIFFLIQMYYSVTEDEAFFRDFLKYVTDLWRNKIESNREYAPIQTILSVILGISPTYENEDEIDIYTSLYEQNLKFLIPQNFENSQICDTLSFVSFAKYFMRFCDCFDFSSTLKEISYMPKFNYNFEPSFKNWFNASPDKNGAVSFLTKQKQGSWLLIPSKAPNKFTFLALKGQNIQALHIKHNPIPDKPSKRYSISFSDCDKYGQSLDEIFTKVLNLSYPDFERGDSYKIPEISYVQPEDIVGCSNSAVNNDKNDVDNGENVMNDENNNDGDEQPRLFFGESQSESQNFGDNWTFNTPLGFSQGNAEGESQNSQFYYFPTPSQS